MAKKVVKTEAVEETVITPQTEEASEKIEETVVEKEAVEEKKEEVKKVSKKRISYKGIY